MKKSVLTLVALCHAAKICAQEPSTPPPAQSSAPPTAADVEALRQQVQSLTDLVKGLQQQVKDEQAARSAGPAEAPNPKLQAPGNSQSSSGEPPLPQNPETIPVPVAGSSPAATPSAAPLFPTEDSSVVASTPSKPSTAAPPVTADGTAVGGGFQTTDSSVVASAESSATGSTGSSLTAPITIGGGKNYMNISLDAMFALAYSSAKDLDHVEVGDHDPQQRGFNARNLELAFDGAVDPYFQGFANIVFKLDNNNETEVEVEEAFLQTTSLPFNLQLKAGQFFAAFGRINPTHPHVWEFADSPLILGRILGPDGLRGIGAQLSWTMPTPWYSQVLMAVQNGRGGTAYSFRNPGDNGIFFDRLTADREIRGLGDLLWVPRWESSVDLSPTQVVLGGVSGAFGSNDTGPHTRTQIYGADFLYKWKSAHAEGGFPFVKWQSEWMYRRFEAGRGVDETFPVEETFHDWGIYSQVLWGFKKGWVAGIRGDYLHETDSVFTSDPDRQTRSRITANLTWYPTEFSKIRLQYQHDFLDEMFFLAGRDVDSVFLQFEFILGAHGAHKF